MANEKRLIDANELKRQILAFATAWRTTFLTVEAIIDRINAESTVDAVEVVHGRLIPTFAKVDCTCSVCRAEFDNILSKALERWNYCPNCGAKMDGDGNG